MDSLTRGNESLLLGIDVGTSACKISLLSSGSLEAISFSSTYPLITPEQDWLEVDPAVVLDRVFHLIKEKVSKDYSDRVKAIGVAGFAPSLIPVDKSGEPLLNCLTNLDKRALREAEWIEAQVGRSKVYEITYKNALPKYLAPKILWIMRNRKHVYQQAYKFLQIKDYLVFKLCGRYSTDPILASNSLLFDLNDGRWSHPMIEALNLDENKLPDIYEPMSIIGTLTSDAAGRTGLREGTPVACGASDDSLAMLALGVFGSTAFESTGTSTIFAVNVRKLLKDPLQRCEVVPGIFPGTYRAAFINHATGAILKWLMEELFVEPASTPLKSMTGRIEKLEAEAEKIEIGSDDLVILPSFEGTGTGDHDRTMKGVFWGLSIRHKKAHIYRALLEGIALRLRDNLGVLREMEVDVDEVISAGGASISRLFRQIKADALGLPVLVAGFPEPSALGAAILAGGAIDILSKPYDVGGLITKNSERTLPRPERYSQYKRLDEHVKRVERGLLH